VRIDKGEGRITRQRDALAGRTGARLPGAGDQARPCKSQQPRDVYVRLDEPGKRIEPALDLCRLFDLNESQVPLGQHDGLITRQSPDDGNPGRFERLRCETNVTRTPCAIENDAGNPHTIAKPLKTPSDGRSRLRLAGNVEHENHGPAGRGGEVGAGPIAPASALRNSVEEAHQALADDDVCPPRTRR